MTKLLYLSYKNTLFALVTTFFCLMLISCSGDTKDFRSDGFPEPLTESQVMELSVESDYMGRDMPCRIYLPKGYGGGEEYPVWYGLNSYSTNEAMWINHGIAEAADELIEAGELRPIIMVFPYTKDADIKEIQKDLEDGRIDERNIDLFISKELVPYIDTHYYTKASADSRYIGGFSMGGMISLRIAFHHTDLFSKVGGYSPSVSSGDYSGAQLEKWLYPNDNIEEINDVTQFAKEKGFDKLTVYLDAGNSNDPFSVGIQSLYEALQKRGITAEFQLYDGGHTLREDSLKKYLTFYAGANEQ